MTADDPALRRLHAAIADGLPKRDLETRFGPTLGVAVVREELSRLRGDKRRFRRADILAALRSSAEPLTAAQVAVMIDGSPESTAARLRAMIETGEAEVARTVKRRGAPIVLYRAAPRASPLDSPAG